LSGTGYSIGVAAADFDNDGWTDLYVTGINQNILYRNNHDGTFTDVTEKAGVSGVNSAGKKLPLSRQRGLITTMMVVSIYS
jgi:hypothetical protein